jgi:hypothetical protein
MTVRVAEKWCKNSLYADLDRALRLQEVEAPRFQDNQYVNVVVLSTLRTLRLTPQPLISVGGWVDLRAIVRQSMKHPNDPIVNRIRALRACSAVWSNVYINNIDLSKCVVVEGYRLYNTFRVASQWDVLINTDRKYVGSCWSVPPDGATFQVNYNKSVSLQQVSRLFLQMNRVAGYVVDLKPLFQVNSSKSARPGTCPWRWRRMGTWSHGSLRSLAVTN